MCPATGKSYSALHGLAILAKSKGRNSTTSQSLSMATVSAKDIELSDRRLFKSERITS